MNTTMEELMKKQIVREAEVNRNITNYKKANKTQKASAGYLTKRVELLEREWEIYKANHEAMLENYDEATHSGLPYFQDDVFSKVEDKVFETIGAIYDILNAKEENSKQCAQSDASQGQPSDGIQLPRITLPKFFGDYKTWSSFHDLFVSRIHENRALSSVQKLHYLKSNLGGEAEQLIRHLQITEVNYDSAWKLLVRRYQNTRALLGAHLKTLFTLPIQSNESASTLKTLMDTTRECLESIKGLGINTENWDPLVLYILTQKLSVETLSDWELRLSKRDDPNEIPSLGEFLECIEARFRTLEAVSSARSRQHPKEKNQNTIRSHNVSDLKERSKGKSPSCSICGQAHQLKDCSKFLASTLEERRTIVQRGAHCYNCLRSGHSVAKCHSKFNCRICGGKHHTLLHSHTGMQDSRQGSNSNSEEVAQQERSVYTSNTLSNESQSKALLATALILARTSEGFTIPLRALLDQGSEASFISHAAAQRLRLKGTATDIHIKVVGGVEIGAAKKIVPLTVCSRYKPDFEVSLEALVLPRLTGLLPPRRINHNRWKHLETLFLADPMYHNPGTIDILLGVRVYAQVIEEGLRKGPHGSPIAQLTSFGWILSGGFDQNHELTTQHKTITTLHSDIHIDALLRRFWEIEEYPLQVHQSDDEERCEQIFRDTVQRQLDGRYTVKLPFNTPDMIPDLGESKQMAVRQLLQVERRLASNPDIANQYSDFMKDYEAQGHMEIVSDKCQDQGVNYLPHHYVLKETSSTTKLRVVFDASRKTSNKKSLNDNLLVGPTIQRDLVSILIRWRRHKIAFTADIKQMYRQILVNKDDTDFQRIVWRYQANEPVREYRLLTVTYGTSCAPYLATRTLGQLAQDEAEAFPDASSRLLQDFYVDDVLSGEDSIAEALKLQANLRQLLKLGRFELRKWVSNHEELLQQIPVEDRELNLPLDITRDITIKALGIYWDPIRDVFNYKVNHIEYTEPSTKRKVLSSIARIFDPLGWLAPIVVTAKLLLQELWIKGLDWDSELPTQMETRWKDYSSQLKDIEQIQIKRWIHYTRRVRLVELHVFSDASMQAYGACVYARVISEDGTIHTNLLTAKTKISPIKPVTLPRLELCGAVLGTKLVRDMANVLEISPSNIYAWTDSKIVLAWVQSHPRQWKQFVANRVAEIQQTLQGTHWNYVASKENPADCASRGLSPLQLKEHDLWWSGPSWLSRKAEEWPTSLTTPAEEPTHIISVETRNTMVHFAFNSAETTGSFIDRFSSYSKLIRITAYCKRFCNNIKGDHDSRRAGHLTVIELQEAEKQLVRLTQRDGFRDEFIDLEGRRPLKVSSKIINLNPFLDNEGLLRVGGRLQNSNLTFNEMHPLILPADKPLSKLKIEELHKTTLHGGLQLMLNILRKTYWVLGARKLVKSVIPNCMTCFRCTARTRSQLMGNLPGPRVKPSRPFATTGVDFAGPVEVKSRTGRGRVQTTKGYIALFICLSTRAIHLEAVSDLSTNAFLAAFKRFTGRRGLCLDLYSDCGTNFVGANRKLSEEHTSFLRSVSTDIHEALTQQRINWHFIPPASPHFGGLWEAGVRSMKYHLKRIMRDVKLTFEELSTTLVQIEACLNSRPLCPLTDDPEDCNALTPGHFLVGDALLAPPETPIPDTQSSYITRWQLLQQQCQDFWKRWSREYLSRLQQRPKWLKKQPNVKVGELVLLKEENLPPSRWLLARIEKTHPGSDGLVRVVTLRCKGSRFKRPIVKICPLPVTES